MMKRISLVLPVVMFAAAPFGALAQDHTIDGQPVPEGQLSAVQERCSELQAQQGTTGSQEPESTMTESTDNETQQNTNENDEGAAFDVSELTLQQCIEGGFTEGKSEN